MKLEDIRVGMKVVPHAKSPMVYWFDFEEWKFTWDLGIYFNHKGYLEVTGIFNDLISLQGDYFLASDFELYEDKENI